MDPIYTTFQISRLLSVDITTVMSWVDEGKLAAYKTPGGHRRIPHAAFVVFLKKYNMPFPDGLAGINTKILIVEDEPQIARLLARFIKKVDEKAEIEIASDGFEAGRKLESLAPDLVVLDLHLPGIDGFKICRNIRAADKMNRTKILAISGYVTDENKKKILAAGADQFMTKPLDLDALGVSVRRLIDEQSKLS